ncbi:hypothetical protein SNEBB_007137, partial [Seison nebaliae]
YCRNGYSVACVEFDRSHQYLDTFSLVNNSQIKKKHDNGKKAIGSGRSTTELGRHQKFREEGKEIHFNSKKFVRAMAREVPFPVSISNLESKTFNEN